ncbi:Uncharacterised protein [Vibrio cholerae]|uniref:Uncharacterized protein n=1 Tax=Vibrio cholerae TaxID=666 RepID=A0A655XK71_VIBCL|nr:Uncharacterised protein [Vibrio cholerae]CSC15084.1 Uncharacterised protein [Vibrio cholerae]
MCFGVYCQQGVVDLRTECIRGDIVIRQLRIKGGRRTFTTVDKAATADLAVVDVFSAACQQSHAAQP